MKKYLTEFIGTFFIVLTVVLTSNDPDIKSMAPLAYGAVYLAMVFAGSHLSGAHFNPAVTLAVLIRGKIDRGDALYYLMAQFIAGALAAAIAVFLHGCVSVEGIAPRLNEQGICIVMAEFLGSFALAYVALNMITAPSNAGSSHYGLAIGFTAMAMGFAMERLSGGAFNPALALGETVAGMFAWGDLWLYLVGVFLGGAAAATVFQATHGKE